MRNALCISVVSVLLRQGFRHRLDTGRGSARSLAKMYAIPGEDRLGLGQGSARSFSGLFFFAIPGMIRLLLREKY